ncbi:hypothetical protein I6A84_13820 [Frankia sp. CNm7]|uniref:Uncharacterized protein n=1 Tax=Frankia nepalensis TaxID=1836974 RepID=A0A937RER9_9ACTN|nr:hypothetical protein [Frankia nepalensis]MBL7497834.1 hypothetical protein [Frankia nepalensis]MBL7509657.1 hypothetical protein [Frankia nepalensis]MBL7519156.1 hypothetical protein [Frankia nepalensis]MBL7630846.1 hypothetical protein [Frankia nepalensis]
MTDSSVPHRSKPLSWVWVILISAGSIVATVGICVASWPISIVGAAVTVLTGIGALVTGIMEDVDENTCGDLWPIGPRDAARRGKAA